jgi:hypothetical protein
MKMAKKGMAMNIEKTITAWVIAIIGLILIFQLIAGFFPSLTTAGTTLNSSGFPFASFFVSGGVAWYLLGAALILLVVKMFIGNKQR